MIVVKIFLAAAAASMLIGVPLARSQSQDLTKFTKLRNFSVSYPRGWTASGDESRLDVLSPSKAPIASGQIVAERQSRIEVVDEGLASQVPLDAIKKKYMTDADPKWAKATVVLSDGKIPISRVRGGCMYMEKVVLKVPSELPENLPVGMPAPNLIHTDIFCVLRDRIISTLETNWEGDASQGRYARVALTMARSIRSK